MFFAHGQGTFGRCLQLLIHELCGEGIRLGSQNLRGVRDQVFALDRFDPNLQDTLFPPEPCEMDMEGMFW